MYIVLRPINEYADVIWDSGNQTFTNKLENIQLDTARIVKEGWAKFTRTSMLYTEIKMGSIKIDRVTTN